MNRKIEEDMMASWRQPLIERYIERKALLSGEFELRGGSKSDFYIDGRKVTTDHIGLGIISDAMMEISRAQHLLLPDTNLVAPVVSGIPIAVGLALRMGMPYLMDRGQPKQHGMVKRFEGEFTGSASCFVVDDLITAGTTLKQTIIGLRELGKSVTDVLVVVDREEGGREALADLGVILHALLTRTELRAAWLNK
jgi:orotate phosphoribosyltransferase